MIEARQTKIGMRIDALVEFLQLSGGEASTAEVKDNFPLWDDYQLYETVKNARRLRLLKAHTREQGRGRVLALVDRNTEIARTRRPDALGSAPMGRL